MILEGSKFIFQLIKLLITFFYLELIGGNKVMQRIFIFKSSFNPVINHMLILTPFFFAVTFNHKRMVSFDNSIFGSNQLLPSLLSCTSYLFLAFFRVLDFLTLHVFSQDLDSRFLSSSCWILQAVENIMIFNKYVVQNYFTLQ